MELSKHCDRRNLSGLAATALVALYSGGTYADIVSTGGTLTGVSPATIASGSASFDATHSTLVTYIDATGHQVTQNFMDTSVSGSILPAGISIDAQAQTFIAAGGPTLATGNATGVIGFDVTAAETVSFSWLEPNIGFTGRDPNGTLDIKAADGSIVLGCAVTDSFNSSNPGGCETGALPNPTTLPPGLLQQGQFNLAAGQYTLDLAIRSTAAAGTPSNGAYQFSVAPVTPVPLPAALPLLLSGIAGLGVMARKRVGRKPA